MIKNYVPSEYREVITYELVFDDGCNNGFGFPCDVNGKLLYSEEERPEAYKSLRYCLKHPEEFVRFNKVIEYRHNIRDNAHGTCECGNEVELYDEYYGACRCGKCGQWYNLFGQELLPPKYWEENYWGDEY